MIVSEAAVIAPGGGGVPGSPGMYTDDHEAGWRGVVDAVHGAGGRIWLQLWHAGRVSHPDWLGGERPVAPSARAPGGTLPVPPGGSYPVPRPLSVREIADVVDAFARSASRARAVGFDGVELHAAQGYLLDQFLRSSANDRSDRYGGSPENRSRLLVEVIEAVATVWSLERIGVQVSPTSSLNDMADLDPLGLFADVAARLSELGIGYLHVHEPVAGPHSVLPRVASSIRRRFTGPLILNGGYDARSAQVAVEEGEADLISFGRPFIRHPDLPALLARGAPLEAPDPTTFYGGGAAGYTDYEVREP
jgi:N-ethylmaleimide reductase